MNNDINQNNQSVEQTETVQVEPTAETAIPVQQIPVEPAPAAPAQQTAPVPGKGMGIASLVLGIVSIVFSYSVFVGLVCGVVGLVLAVLGKKKGFNGGIIKAGLVLSIIGTALSGIYLISCIACASAIGGGANAIGRSIESSLDKDLSDALDELERELQNITF